ncbi:MAG TPA: AMP-binding protein, partial [Blastocatellia bacterium]|nr:AMP-binding protein [Blastocatellia bacterium]
MSTQPNTLNELFNGAVDRYRDSEFLRFKQTGEWKSLAYGEVARRVRELALGLYSVGLRAGDRIAIWSENRPEWNIADLGSLAVGAIDVPIYATQTPSQVEYILADSGARGLFVSSAFLDEALRIKTRVESLEFVFPFDSVAQAVPDSSIIPAEDLVSRGRALFGEQPSLYESLWRTAKPDDLATLLYTSGTTGDPKGVMLTHRNLTANALNTFRWLSLEGRRDLALTYLPFSHIFERGAFYLYAHAGSVVAYAESIDTVAKNLLEIKPTVMTSVPRMFEKIYAKIMERGLAAGFPKKQIFLWALQVGREWAMKKNRGERPGFWLALKHRL